MKVQVKHTFNVIAEVAANTFEQAKEVLRVNFYTVGGMQYRTMDETLVNSWDGDAKAETAYEPVSDSGEPMRYWAVTGRIPGDYEDVLIQCQATCREEAVANFDKEIWDLEFSGIESGMERENAIKESRESTYKSHGQEVFINSVVVSSSPIEVM